MPGVDSQISGVVAALLDDHGRPAERTNHAAVRLEILGHERPCPRGIVLSRVQPQSHDEERRPKEADVGKSPAQGIPEKRTVDVFRQRIIQVISFSRTLAFLFLETAEVRIGSVAFLVCLFWFTILSLGAIRRNVDQ